MKGEKTENDKRETEEEGRWTMDDGREDERRTDEKGTKKIKTVRDLKVYRKAFDSAMEIFELTKKFPKEETYSLTDQIRRASRSVCSNLSEGWRKRRYKAVFLNKLTDSWSGSRRNPNVVRIFLAL